MNIVALETGGAAWGVACVRFDSEAGEAELLAVTSNSQPRELSQQLFSRIESTLDAAGWSLEDVDALAIGLGPGSWTGLRIGLTAAKTLAQARGWKLVGVPSFNANAQAIWRARDENENDENENDESESVSGESTLLLVAAPCRPNEIYAKIFEVTDEYVAVAQTEWIGSPELVADTLRTEALARGFDESFLLTGNAAPAVADCLAARGAEYSVCEAEFEECLLEVAVAAMVKIENDEVDEPSAVQPLYLAPSNAERNLLGRS